GTAQLPQVMVVGLVSAYDAFLAHLLRAVFSIHPETVLTSEKSIKFSDLINYSSIEEARSSLIEREIDTVIRSSHHDQFAWMEQRFSIPLRDNLAVWPKFIELCERRNLLSHTGGTVSAQYLAVCKAHGVDVVGLKLGQKLIVTSEYLAEAVRTVYEI